MDDFLPRPLVDEQPGTLISERDFSDYPLHLLTEEQAMTQHYPSSTLMVSTGYETTNQPDLIAIPALGAPPHQKLQPQIATFHGGVSYAMLPPCVPLSHKTTYGPRYGPSRQNTVSKRGKLSEAQRKEIRAYSLKNRSANQKAIAGKRIFQLLWIY
jgi:hypothetical protein